MQRQERRELHEQREAEGLRESELKTQAAERTETFHSVQSHVRKYRLRSGGERADLQAVVCFEHHTVSAAGW